MSECASSIVVQLCPCRCEWLSPATTLPPTAIPTIANGRCALSNSVDVCEELGTASACDPRNIQDCLQYCCELNIRAGDLICSQPTCISLNPPINEMVQIRGSFIIRGSTIDVVAESSNSSNLQHIDGDMIIDNTLGDVSLNGGFQLLAMVSGNVSISSNPNMTSLDGSFPRLRHIGGNLRIENCRSLASIQNAFPVLESIGGDLIIEDNRLLSSLATSFSSLARVTGSIRITNNNRRNGYTFDTSSILSPALCCTESVVEGQAPAGSEMMPSCPSGYEFLPLINPGSSFSYYEEGELCPVTSPSASPTVSLRTTPGPTLIPTITPPGMCLHVEFGAGTYPCFEQPFYRCSGLRRCEWVDVDRTSTTASVAEGQTSEGDGGGSSGFVLVLGAMVGACVILLVILLVMRKRRVRRLKLIAERQATLNSRNQRGVDANIPPALASSQYYTHTQNQAYENAYDVDIEVTRRPKSNNRRDKSRTSSVYGDSVSASLGTLEEQYVKVMKDEWILNNPNVNPNRDAYWLAREEEIREEFRERFHQVEDKRKTYHEEEEEDFEGFAAIGGYSHEGDVAPMESLEIAIEQALETAEVEARAAGELRPDNIVAAIPVSIRDSIIDCDGEDDDDPNAVPKDLSKWYHGVITKRQSHELLLANAGHEQDGKFLIRARPDHDGEHILSVIYKGKPTHHLIRATSEADPALILNNKACEENVTSLVQLVEYLRDARSNWPVPLTVGVEGLRIRGSPRPKSLRPVSVVSLGKPDPVRGSWVSETSFGNPDLSKPKGPNNIDLTQGAGLRLSQIPTADYSDDESTAANSPTPTLPAESQFSYDQTQPSSISAVNSKIAEDHQDNSEDSDEGGGYLELAGVNESSAVSEPTPPWLHPDMSREKAGELVLSAGTGDGTFLVRLTDESPEKYYLCVQFKKKPTHHLIQRNTDDIYVVNNKEFGENATMPDLIKALDHKQPRWPVGLITPLLASEDVQARVVKDIGRSKIDKAADEADVDEEDNNDHEDAPPPGVVVLNLMKTTATDALPNDPESDGSSDEEESGYLELAGAPAGVGESEGDDDEHEDEDEEEARAAEERLIKEAEEEEIKSAKRAAVVREAEIERARIEREEKRASEERVRKLRETAEREATERKISEQEAIKRKIAKKEAIERREAEARVLAEKKAHRDTESSTNGSEADRIIRRDKKKSDGNVQVRESMALGRRPSVSDRRAMFLTSDSSNRDSNRMSDLAFMLGDDSDINGINESSTDDAVMMLDSLGESSTDEHVRPVMKSLTGAQSGESETDSSEKKTSSISLQGIVADESSTDSALTPEEKAHIDKEKEKFRQKMIEDAKKRPVKEEPKSNQEAKIFFNAGDEIAELAKGITKSSSTKRAGKYFDPVEGPRESMAIGQRPSVAEMLRSRQR